jgi:hypothetical protein
MNYKDKIKELAELYKKLYKSSKWSMIIYNSHNVYVFYFDDTCYGYFYDYWKYYGNEYFVEFEGRRFNLAKAGNIPVKVLDIVKKELKYQ